MQSCTAANNLMLYTHVKILTLFFFTFVHLPKDILFFIVSHLKFPIVLTTVLFHDLTTKERNLLQKFNSQKHA